jgi:hypothetical protein
MYTTFENLYRYRFWKDLKTTSKFLGPSDILLDCDSVTSFPSLRDSEILGQLVFVSHITAIYALLDEKILSIPEAIEHRILRSRKAFPKAEDVRIRIHLETRFGNVAVACVFINCTFLVFF